MPDRKTLILQGIAASPGIVIGKAFLMEDEELCLVQKEISKEDAKKEVIRFREAISKTRAEMIATQEKIYKTLTCIRHKFFHFSNLRAINSGYTHFAFPRWELSCLIAEVLTHGFRLAQRILCVCVPHQATVNRFDSYTTQPSSKMSLRLII